MLLSALFLLGVASISHAAVMRYDPRIIDGEDVELGEIPYQVSLQRKSSAFHFCGGSILDEKHVLTAAHCVDEKFPSEIMVVAGIVDLDTARTYYEVESITTHEKYDPDNSWINDIALITIKGKFIRSSTIGFVPLPEQDETVTAGSTARVSGFGRLTPDGPGSRILQKATIFIADQQHCRNMYWSIAKFIYDVHICANDPSVRRGSCKGDSGGPLVVNGKVVGLVSWAKACSLTDFPTVYTRVPSHINWIREHLV